MPGKTIQKSNAPNHMKDLVLLFAIPIAIAVFAAVIIHIPRLLANPKYNFIYSICDRYDCRDSYSVDAAGLVVKNNATSPNSNYYNHYSTIRYYDANTDSTKNITLEEVRRYRLNTSSKSPDGYKLTREETSSGFLFWGDYDQGWYLKNGAKKKKVELSNTGSTYVQNVNFLGWVDK